MSIKYTMATPADYEAIARLHARSWQEHYRGIFSDSYLDDQVEAVRLEVWKARLSDPPANQHLLLAKEGDQLIGFACTYLSKDPVWGSLLDNLHVLGTHQGRGIGKTLLKAAARMAFERTTDEKFYLWVLEDNEASIRFYEQMGGRIEERFLDDLPGGGQAYVFRFVWSQADELPEY